MDRKFLIDCLIKIILSIACGAVLGIERRSRSHVIGMRTLILISVSSTLLSIVSIHITEAQTAKGFYGGDPTRIIAGIVSGIGFIGGGAIMRQGLNVKGITSAAIIFASSALGMAIGAGLYIQSGIVLFVFLFLLIMLEKFEIKIFPGIRSKNLQLVFEQDDVDMSELERIIKENGFIIADVNISRVMAAHKIILRYSVKAPRSEDYNKMIEELKTVGSLSEFSITD